SQRLTSFATDVRTNPNGAIARSNGSSSQVPFQGVPRLLQARGLRRGVDSPGSDGCACRALRGKLAERVDMSAAVAKEGWEGCAGRSLRDATDRASDSHRFGVCCAARIAVRPVAVACASW